MERVNILIIDDDELDRQHFRRLLKKVFSTARIFESSGDLETILSLSVEPQIAFIDYRLPLLNGIEMMEEVLRKWPCAACIIATGQGDEEIAKTTIKKGAFDYIAKSKLSEQPMKRVIENAMAWRDMQRRLEDQQRELELFADVLLHDLKAPVRSIQFFVSEIESEVDPKVLKSVETEMRLLRRSARQIALLLDSLGSHIRACRSQDFENATLRAVIDQSLLSLDRDLAEAEAKITVDVQDQILLCSPPQLAQLFQNLVNNALKYCGEKRPIITISGKNFDNSRIEIIIADNGIGISPEYVERVFEPFKRISPRGEISGTGLGLATCRKIAERHGGHIWCESELGTGSRFVLSLPCAICPKSNPQQDFAVS
ncbi:response regulator receiver sensor signal transduction histidine kinase [Citreicella sp. 357]|nr:response regulator receiver sensor signal transduction histidine kinase [Citreicella sp. 357]